MSPRGVRFLGQRRVEVSPSPAPTLSPVGLRVRSLASAISAGTELLVYRGELEADVPLDATLGWASTQARYPLAYGYAQVGQVVEVGGAADAGWLGRRVFGFHPHQEETVDEARAFVPLPDGLGVEAACLLANMETAVSLAMDGAPTVGERVAVVGHGVVGQLTSALLARTGVEAVHVVEPRAERQAGLLEGQPRCTAAAEVTSATRGSFDVVYEVSGQPQALDAALALSRHGGRVVVGSWYGSRRAAVELGTRLHRQRLTLLFSQVSTIDARFAARFDKARRLEVALAWLARLPVERLVTHRVPFVEAARAYSLLDSGAPGVLQVLLTHA